MNDVRIARITGAFGLACVALTFGQFPLWLGDSPSVYDGSGFGRHLYAIKNVAFTRILMDQLDFLKKTRRDDRGQAAERSVACASASS
jgi:hypothetical protein